MGIHSRVSVEIPDDGREEEEEREGCSRMCAPLDESRFK